TTWRPTRAPRSPPTTNGPRRSGSAISACSATGRNAMSSLPAAERGELEAFRDVWRAASPAVAGDLGLARLERGGTLAIACSAFAGVILPNRVLGLGLAEPADEALLDELDAFFAAAGTGYAVALAPGARPADLPERLEAHGFRPGYGWTKFERP